MASINAQKVALRVKEKVSKGEKVNLGQLVIEQGYSKHIKRQPSKVTKTKSYQAIIVPFINRLEQHRDKLINELNARDLTKEEYRTLSESLDRMTKSINLLSGKATENIATTVNIVNYDNVDITQTNQPKFLAVNSVQTVDNSNLLDSKETVDN